MSGFYSYDLHKKRSDDGVLHGASARKSTLGNVATLASLGLEEAASANELKMSDALRARFDRQHGYKMDSVKLVESPLAKHLGTRGFAQGNVIHIASGAYNPHTAHGVRLLSHEFSHVVQQATGRASGLNASLNDGLEAEANAGIGDFSTADGGNLPALPAISAASAPVQAEGGLKKFLRKFAPTSSGPKTISEQLASVPAISAFASSAKAKAGKALSSVASAVPSAYHSFIKDPHQEAMDRLNANKAAYDQASRWERFKFTAANPIARIRASGHKGDTESRKARYEALDNLAMRYKEKRKQLKQDRAQAAQEPTGLGDVDEAATSQGGPQLDLEQDIPAPPQPTVQDTAQRLDAGEESAYSAQPFRVEPAALIADRQAAEISRTAGLTAPLQSLDSDAAVNSQGRGPQPGLSLDDDTPMAPPGAAHYLREFGGPAQPQADGQTGLDTDLQNRKAQARTKALSRLAPLGEQSDLNLYSTEIGLGGMAAKLGGGTGLMQIGSLAKNIPTVYTGMGVGALGHAVSAINEAANAARHSSHGNRSAALSSGLSSLGQIIGGASTAASALRTANTVATGVPAISAIVPGLGIAAGSVQAAKGAVDARMGAKTQKAMEGRLGSRLAEFKTAASQEPGDAPVDFKRRFDKTTRHQIMMRNAAKRRKVGGAIDIAAGSTKAVTSGVQLGLTLSGVGAPIGTAIGMGGTAVSGTLGVAKTVATMAMKKQHSAEALKLGYNIDVERAQVRRIASPEMELSDKEVDYIVFKSRGIESGKESDALNIYYLRQAKKLKAAAAQEGPAGETARAMLREAGLSGKDLPLEGIAHVMGAPETISARKAVDDASLTRFQPSWKPKEPESEGPSIGSRISSGVSGAWQSVRKKFSRTKSPAAAT